MSEDFSEQAYQAMCKLITNYQEMRQAAFAYAERAAEKLREEKQYCRQICESR